MTQVAFMALIVGIVAAVYSAAALVIGARKGYPELLASGRNAALAVTGLVVFASLVLFYSLLTRDFSLIYVYDYTSRDLPLLYTISAFWAGQEGSLLFWALLLSIFTAIVIFQYRNRHRELLPYVVSILVIVDAFFIAMATLVTNVFAKQWPVPADGFGLNPLLQNPGMIIHPPTLFLGYVGVAIPFAFAMAALITGRLNDSWIRSTRSWAIFAWFFLTLGNILGGQWAYTELGWGGYWAWDPVENASLMPWLTATAYIHSVMMQQRRGMFKIWNVVLAAITFLLSIFGTFLVRSGVLSSVHAFAPSALGTFFGILLVGFAVFSLALIFSRLSLLKGENDFGAWYSKESSFMLNNLIMAAAAIAVFWGTMYPLIAQTIQGQEVSVGAAFFNTFNGPIFLVMVILMGVCPLVTWHAMAPDKFLKRLIVPGIAAILTAIVLFGVFGVREFISAILPSAAAAFVLVTIASEIVRGVVANSRRLATKNVVKSTGNMVARNKPRYGGYIVHAGIALIVIGVIGSTGYQVQEDFILNKGETAKIGNYVLTYDGIQNSQDPTKALSVATLTVQDTSGNVIDTMKPERILYQNQQQPHSNVAIRTTLGEDLYIVYGGSDPNGSNANFHMVINPLVVWIWIGAGILVLGSMISMWPSRQTSEVFEARYAKELAETGQPVPVRVD